MEGSALTTDFQDVARVHSTSRGVNFFVIIILFFPLDGQAHGDGVKGLCGRG